jgi:hypothetical protein
MWPINPAPAPAPAPALASVPAQQFLLVLAPYTCRQHDILMPAQTLDALKALPTESTQLEMPTSRVLPRLISFSNSTLSSSATLGFPHVRTEADLIQQFQQARITAGHLKQAHLTSPTGTVKCCGVDWGSMPHPPKHF